MEKSIIQDFSKTEELLNLDLKQYMWKNSESITSYEITPLGLISDVPEMYGIEIQELPEMLIAHPNKKVFAYNSKLDYDFDLGLFSKEELRSFEFINETTFEVIETYSLKLNDYSKKAALAQLKRLGVNAPWKHMETNSKTELSEKIYFKKWKT
jgi:hypothetical protein